MKFIQLYQPHKDTYMIKTGKGPMTYINFLKAEKARIEQNPKRIAKIVSSFGYSWLVCNSVVADRNYIDKWRDVMPPGQKNAKAY